MPSWRQSPQNILTVRPLDFKPFESTAAANRTSKPLAWLLQRYALMVRLPGNKNRLGAFSLAGLQGLGLWRPTGAELVLFALTIGSTA